MSWGLFGAVGHLCDSWFNLWVTLWAVVIGMLIPLTIRGLKLRRQRMTILQRNGIPSLEPNLLTGNMREYDSVPNVLFDSGLIRSLGSVCGYYVGAKPVILIQDKGIIELMQTKLKKNFLDRPRRVPGGINPCPKRKLMLGNLPVEDWQKMRKILAPAFSSHNLSAMLESIASRVDIFMRLIHDKCSDEIDFYPLFQYLALDIIGRTAFGVDSNIQTCKNDKLLEAVKAEFSKSTNGYLLRLYLCLPEFTPFLKPLREKWQSLLNVLGKVTSSALWEEGRRAVIERRNAPVDPNRVYNDLLHHLMHSTHDLPDDSIVANTVLIFEAAYETTSSCLAFMVHLLAHNPRYQKKIRKEIRKCEKFHELNSYAGVQSLRFLEACVYEALRLYPTQTTFIGRSAEVDIDCSVMGTKIVIPKGVHVQAALYQIHRSDEYWKRPNKFLPKRFLGEDKDKLKTSVYQAFGHGPRECIGKGFALMVLKCILASLLSKYKLVPSERTEKLGEISIIYKTATMTPSKGSHARAVRLGSA
ncbi:unnamed protein product [Allacma fusca]|uniref:Cytochrome P450 n=1 Tax=Allacma fusca TaxID=39272 RepID=A0A8J2JNY5_9HEXA|nr:unnamed protein product [Allacma fusca]